VCHRHRPRAFTLVELLIVIGIIALLISILLPTIARARKQANSVACLSNVRQLTMAMISYANENKGNTMPLDMTPGKYWHHMLAPHLGDQRYDAAADDPELVMSKVMLCPEAPRSEEITWGSATTAWHYAAGEGTGSYGINLWLLPKNTLFPMPKERYWHKMFTAKGGGTDVPVVGDSNWVGSWPDNNDIVLGGKYQTGWTPHANGYFMGRFVIARHGRAINMGFLDGSARRVELPELWKLRWHRLSVPRDVTLP
jgi:prepilin-type N-terminal cleavage/methylation domain-containing protein/prepilin-type processing-associated H-X9-DG protein